MLHPITAEEMNAAREGQQSDLEPEDLDELLEAVQENIWDHWNEQMDSIEDGSLRLVAESDEALLFADETGQFWQSQFDSIVEYINLLGTPDEGTPETVLAAHHNAAYRLVDYNWSTANPVVTSKPADFDRAQRFVEAVINGLIARGLSPGQAWGYYGVIIRGHSRNQWAQRCGYADHSAVSEAVRKAEKKLGIVDPPR